MRNDAEQYGADNGADDDVTTGKRSQGDDVASLTGKIMEANQEGNTKEAARLHVLLIDAQNKKFAAQGLGAQDIDQSG